MKKGYWTIRYTFINILYFVAFCTVHAYATVFMLDRGFTNTLVGVALAVSNILAVVGQPLVAGIIDKSEKITNRRVLMGAILIIYTVQFISMSIMIAMSFEYQSEGCTHNFGLARGLGSAGFAVTSAITGGIMARRGPGINLYITATVMVLMFIAVYTFRKHDVGTVIMEEKAECTSDDEEPANNLIDFIRRYPAFMTFLLGAALCFFSHNMLNDYLIQIIRNLGGGETELGYASFLQAILELPVMAVMAGILRKISVKVVLIFSSVAFVLKVVIMYLATGLGGMYISQSFQLFAYAVFIPATAYYSDKIMKEKDKVKGQAYVNCAITLGGVFSSLICGRILDKRGVSVMLALGIAVAVAGALIAAGAMIKEKNI